jgi:predicted AlkP superfamily phosphohydrolase/phosphomutase/tetratricopeptide (TPR) repeat protein
MKTDPALFAEALSSSEAASAAASASLICSHARILKTAAPDHPADQAEDPAKPWPILPLLSGSGIETLAKGAPSDAEAKNPPDAQHSRRKVLLIGWDAADWKVIRPLMDAGKMPTLARLISGGCTSSIATLQPSFSPMLWTSIATGKRPFTHGIHGFTEPRPDGLGVRRVTNLSRKCKALWNILSQNDLRGIVVGWWPSFPAEPIRGVMVSDQYHRAVTDFKMVPGMVHPQSHSDALAVLRINPEDLSAETLEYFIPRAREIDQQKDRRLYSAARVVAECANIHMAATCLMDREPWDLCAVYFDAIDHFCHGFMKFHPPRRSQIAQEDFDLYRNVVQAGYQLHDKMLGTLLEKAGDDARVILLSDHGFHPDHLRPLAIPLFHAGPVTEHRNNGVLIVSGPGIRKDEIRRGEEILGTDLLDITPTVLSMFGLPSGLDMEGKPLAAIFETPPVIEPIPTWEKVEGHDGCHPPHMQLDPMAATESLEQLVALGYVEEPDADNATAIKRTIVDLRTNLAEAYQDAGRHPEAAAILRELRADDPDDQRVALRLFISSEAMRNVAEMKSIAADWSGRRRILYEENLRRLEEPGVAQSEDFKQLKRVCRYDPALTPYFETRIAFLEKRWQDALANLRCIPAEDLIRPGFYTDRATLLGRLGRWEEAESVLREAFSLEMTDARLHFAHARVALHKRDYEKAVQSAQDGLALLTRDPRGHYLLGIALTCLKRCADAVAAFSQALEINPHFPAAHLWLARIKRRYLNDFPSARVHADFYRQLRNNLHKSEIIAQTQSSGPPPRPVAFAASARDLPPLSDEAVIVSGLPRSGTSMLMQMLVAGGLTPLTDGLRQPDEDNPRGYFEFEPVKQMTQDTSWIDQARGKVLKIVAPMIPNLPENLPCRVILIERNLNEILASQRQMIVRRGRDAGLNPARENRLKQEYLRLIIWTKGYLAGRPGTRLMCVDRDAVLRDPQGAAEAINRFLGGALDTGRIAAEVKPELNRQRRV